jgi:CCR4-NOT transcription complex subunit 9
MKVKSFSFYRAREALRQCLPDQLRDNTFAACLKDDKSTKQWLAQLMKNLEGSTGMGGVDPRMAVPPIMNQQ